MFVKNKTLIHKNLLSCKCFFSIIHKIDLNLNSILLKNFNFNAKLFNKSRNNKPLDLSLTIRFANIPNNAHFDLKSAPIQRKESKITLALQLESGDRKIDDFDSNQNLWDIIQELFVNNPILNYGSDMNLCVIYMRKEVLLVTIWFVAD